MKLLFCLSLTTAILSGLWAWVADLLGLIGWAGFLGCTAYFAYPKDGIKGLGITALTVSSGVVWGLVILHSGSYLQNLPSFIGYFVTGFVAFFMCIQAKKQWLSYIPGTFVGTCTIFAAQGACLITIQSLLIGIVFGFSMKKSGMWLAEK
ncbi:DUF1097 domain-containing protein [Providencia sp. SP181]|uniref:DUF1097 domain-containing protein n=1 Tax=Providencia sp. SP181 TaxID=3136277 RepID=UPI003D2AB53C